jgi:hypothetical protein
MLTRSLVVTFLNQSSTERGRRMVAAHQGLRVQFMMGRRGYERYDSKIMCLGF